MQQEHKAIRQKFRAPRDATFAFTDAESYVPLVTLSTQNNNKLLQQLKTGFKRIIKWNKYRSERSNQTKNNSVNYLIDPTFIKIKRLFMLSFEGEVDRISFSKYYTPSVEIKDFNVLIDSESFLGTKQRRSIRKRS